ncbi:phasin family protein [Albimonas sp. CAU 1670]|uniref:phasin family protein n=1 Tax=Albimonas sp. CAU 1670 TaxID=3032599 RepID=UPI0023DC26A8|nr:phasin family protein [Albimonas sp. CAU 1670]MDF2235728.1 phasin family protein [Albimonas sp. CAU 1670]
MAKQTAKSTAKNMQSPFASQGFQDIFMTWATINERMAAFAVEAGTRATDMASEIAKEALSNVRELSQVRSDPAEYGKACTEFMQKQTELFARSATAYAEETQKVGAETADLASKAGEEITGKVAANAESAAKIAGTADAKAA